MFYHEDLRNYYVVNFILMQHHKYSLSELEDMLPWEREIYITQLESYIKEENDRIREMQNKHRQRF